MPLHLDSVPLPGGLKQRLAAVVQKASWTSLAGSMNVDALEWEDLDQPGVRIHWLRRDEDAGTTAVLLHIRAGHTFLNHRHIGSEDCLVIRGTLRDSRGVYHAGDYVFYEAGSIQQDIRALEGEDCILFLVNQRGIEPV
jgi:anti-sigma factor ChrR (cupin superfamily)